MFCQLESVVGPLRPRPFHRVFEVLDKIERHLAPMWETAPDPFGMQEQ